MVLTFLYEILFTAGVTGEIIVKTRSVTTSKSVYLFHKGVKSPRGMRDDSTKD